METVRGSSRVPCGAWFVGALTLLSLTACGTARPTEEAAPPGPAGVNIGYGEVDKDHEVGAVRSVRAEDDGPQFRSLIEMLSRVPGVRVMERPGGEMTVRIRGSSSFLSDEEPLFVVDGMAVQSASGVLALNPNNIASITVLKDAGDTAIYGSRGANGVILIKTKRK